MNKIISVIDRILFDTITPGLFRFLLATLVAVYHSVAFLTIGHYAVYVFLMLSGYWIFRMYGEKYILYKKSYWVYILSRMARLMPMYWLILIFSVILYFSVPVLAQRLEALKDQSLSIGFHNLFVLGIASSDFQFVGTSWSLDIEMQFYIVAPFLLLLVRRNGGWPLFITASAVSVFLVYYQPKMVNLLVYLPYFVIGGLIYHYDFIASRKWARGGMLLVLGILAVNYLVPTLRNDYLLNRQTAVFGINYREGLNVLLALLTAPFVSVNVRQSTVKELMGREQLFSSMSYIIYLLHWPLLQLYSVCVTNVSLARKMSYLSLYYIACLLLSYLIAKYVDAYFEKLRRRWIGGMDKKFKLQVSPAK